MNLSTNSEIIKMKGQNTSRITTILQYQTEAGEYKFHLDGWGAIVADIVFELYATRELSRRMEPAHRTYTPYIPESKLLGSGRTLLIETEAGATVIREGEVFGQNRRRIILGELTLTEGDGLVFKMNAIEDLNLDPQGIIKIVKDPRYRL